MEKKPFVVEEYVRWSDVDHAGIIFYGSYVRFFEIAETELFRELGVPYASLFDRFDFWLPRAHMEVDFHYPARLDDRLEVVTYFTSLGNSSIKIAFDVWHPEAGRFAATGSEVLVCTDRASLESKPIPPELRQRLERVLLEPESARSYVQLHC